MHKRDYITLTDCLRLTFNFHMKPEICPKFRAAKPKVHSKYFSSSCFSQPVSNQKKRVHAGYRLPVRFCFLVTFLRMAYISISIFFWSVCLAHTYFFRHIRAHIENETSKPKLIKFHFNKFY